MFYCHTLNFTPFTAVRFPWTDRLLTYLLSPRYSSIDGYMVPASTTMNRATNCRLCAVVVLLQILLMPLLLLLAAAAAASPIPVDTRMPESTIPRKRAFVCDTARLVKTTMSK